MKEGYVKSELSSSEHQAIVFPVIGRNWLFQRSAFFIVSKNM